MRRAVAGIWDVPLEGGSSALAVTAAFFFLGGIAGCLLAASVGGSGSDSLASYIEGFWVVARSESVTRPDLLPLIWEVLRWPLFTVIFSFTALGLIGIPVLFSIRGFLLSFAIASFSRIFGGTGALMALVVFGVSGLFSIPALFALGVHGFAAARGLAGRALGEGKRFSPFGRAYFLRCGVCAGAFCVCIVLEYLVVPVLVAGMAGLIPA
ncbi:conserved membrane hypothetical protein [uncultured Eubacteriales bacterium]|uniref:Stage II sporulation protein M n=1 Tax=uncultured Eubacteriales bacterium TaxID=172733 RepID=A0A212JW38_9FIRM|nr:conserved membrane hypothetical protein [uncultured Eubacteriales bacterium]